MRLLGVASFLLAGLPCAAIAQDVAPANMPRLDAPEAPHLEYDELERGDTEGNANDEVPLVDPARLGIQPTPSSEDTAPSSSGSSTRILEELPKDQGIHRTYMRITTRDTSIRRRQRTHELQDRVRQDLEVELLFGDAVEDPARIQVRVLSASQSSEGSHGPLNLAIPEQGLTLYCWQGEFDSLCRDPATQNEVEWPSWATLDFAAWTTSGPVNVGTRWRERIPKAAAAGWADGHNNQATARFEVARSHSEAAVGKTVVEATLETDAELMVFSEVRRYPAIGTLEFVFDHEKKLIDRFLITWKGDLNVEGNAGGDAYRWERSTQVRLLITSSVEQ